MLSDVLESENISVQKACQKIGYPRALVLYYIDKFKENEEDTALLSRYSLAIARIVENTVREAEDISEGKHRGEAFEDSGTSVARDRLMLHAKMWALGKMMPTKMGEKKEEKDDSPTKVVIVGGLPDSE